MTKRRFTFSAAGESLAKNAGLVEAATAFKKENNLYADEIDRRSLDRDETERWGELRGEAHDLAKKGAVTPPEIDFVLARLSREPVTVWAIEGENTESNLLGIPEIARRVATSPLQDACVLSGTEGLYLLNEHAEVRTALENELKHPLAAAAFAGAYLLKEPKAIAVTKQVESGIVREISFPADMHGDFRIAVGESYRNGSITPLGENVVFAPLPERKVFAAYHSVEPEILLAAMKYLDVIGMRKADQIMLFESIVEQAGDVSYGGNFGDFGDDDLEESFYVIEDENRYWDKTIARARAQPKFELMSSIVLPQNQTTRFVIAVRDTQFVIKNVWKGESGEESESFELGADELAVFIKVMIMSPGGRTAPQTLIAMIKARVEKIKKER